MHSLRSALAIHALKLGFKRRNDGQKPRRRRRRADLACEALRKTLEARNHVDESAWILVDRDEAEWDIIDYDDAGTSQSALERARADLEASLGA